jgi:hypothetical protein
MPLFLCSAFNCDSRKHVIQLTILLIFVFTTSVTSCDHSIDLDLLSHSIDTINMPVLTRSMTAHGSKQSDLVSSSSARLTCVNASDFPTTDITDTEQSITLLPDLIDHSSSSKSSIASDASSTSSFSSDGEFQISEFSNFQFEISSFGIVTRIQDGIGLCGSIALR